MKNIKKLKLYDFEYIIPVRLSHLVWEKIRYLCSHINEVEWSGCTFYSIEGDLTKPESVYIKVEDMIPLDKGSTGFTEYSFDQRVLSYMMEKDYFHLKIGHLHSHHNMKTFFSGTDTDEVVENSEHIKPYLSIIVNNRHEFSAKIAFRIKTVTPTTFQFQNIDNSITTLSSVEEDEYVGNYNCKIVLPEIIWNVDETFLNQFTAINKPKPAPKIDFHKPKVGNVKPNSKYTQTELFDEASWWQENNSIQPEIVTFWNASEPLFCKILRLGMDVPNDNLEQALEDLENSATQAKDFNLSNYAASIKSNFKKWVYEFYEKPFILKSELDDTWEDFIEELIYSADEFVVLSELIELLTEENTL